MSVFEFSVSRIFCLLVLLLFAGACSRQPPSRVTEISRRDVAARFRAVVKSAGGSQIWIKRSTRAHHGRVPVTSLQVVATPSGYHAVLTALHQEARRDKVELRYTVVSLGGGRHLALLNVMDRGETLVHMQVREMPRLLRAAIVIDDMGRDLDAAHKLLALDYPLTFSVLPYLRYSQATAEEVHRHGHEVMLHLPMEPEPSAHASPGEGAILVGMTPREVQRVVQKDLAFVPFVSGVNNHMGSRATQDTALMIEVMKILAARRLYFIDSRTTGASQALEAAQREHLPTFYRAVFLDDTESVGYTLGQLREFRRRIEQTGVALAIGHPHATTIAALAKFLPEFERSDIELVPPSQLVHLPDAVRLLPPGKPGT